MILDNITVIIVSYNTPELLKKCIGSIRNFYPEIKIIIIDGSPVGSDCWNYCKELMLKNYYSVKMVGYNIGHGNGMKMGIEMCHTKYFLLMDSDAEIKLDCLHSMITMFRPGMYGMGEIVTVNNEGGNVEIGIPYLHPYFAMINREEYLKYAPIINHGAPLIKSMISINGKSMLANMKDIKAAVEHKGRGTREQNPKEFNPGNWDQL